MGKKEKKAKEKPLEKMTAKELREVGKQIPEISGVHGMNKIELINAIKKARGIEEGPVKQADTSVREIKKKIKALRADREVAVEANDLNRVAIYKKRINRLKKKTRKAA